jgi:hypothetical protein
MMWKLSKFGEKSTWKIEGYNDSPSILSEGIDVNAKSERY